MEMNETPGSAVSAAEADYEPLPEAAPETDPKAGSGITKRGVIELVFALFALVCAYFFTEIFPVCNSPLGFLLLAAVLLFGTLAAALILGAKPGAFSYGALVFALAAAFCRFLNGGDLQLPHH